MVVPGMIILEMQDSRIFILEMQDSRIVILEMQGSMNFHTRNAMFQELSILEMQGFRNCHTQSRDAKYQELSYYKFKVP